MVTISVAADCHRCNFEDGVAAVLHIVGFEKTFLSLHHQRLAALRCRGGGNSWLFFTSCDAHRTGHRSKLSVKSKQ